MRILKDIIIGLAIGVLAVPLSACAGLTGTSITASNAFQTFVADAVTACSFVPTAEDFTNILTADPTVATVEAAVTELCKIATTQTATSSIRRPGAAAPIKLQGYFLSSVKKTS